MTEVVIHGKPERLVRNNHGQHHQKEQNLVSLEAELCKAIADQTANEGLQNRTGKGKDKRVLEGVEIPKLRNNLLILFQREILGNQPDRGIDKVLPCHEGRADLCDERIQHHVGNADQKEQAENVDHRLGKEGNIKKFRLEPVLERSSFEVHSDPVLGFPHDLRTCVLCVHN